MPTEPNPTPDPRKPRKQPPQAVAIPTHPIPAQPQGHAIPAEPVSDSTDPWGQPSSSAIPTQPVSDTSMYSIGAVPGEEPLRPGYRTIDGDTGVRTNPAIGNRTASSPNINVNTTSARMRRSTTSISKRSRSAGTSARSAAATTTQMRASEHSPAAVPMAPAQSRSMAGALWAVAALLAIGLTVVLLIVVIGPGEETPSTNNDDTSNNTLGNNANNDAANAAAQAKADADFWWRDLGNADQAYANAQLTSDVADRKAALLNVLGTCRQLRERSSKLILEREAITELDQLSKKVEGAARDACVAIVEAAAVELIEAAEFDKAIALVEGVAAGERADLVEQELITDDLRIYLDDLAYEYGVLKREFNALDEDSKTLARAWLPIKPRFTDEAIAGAVTAADARRMAEELLLLLRQNDRAETIPDELVDALEAAAERAEDLIDAESTTALRGLPDTHADVVATYENMQWFLTVAGDPPLNERILVEDAERLAVALRFYAEPAETTEAFALGPPDAFSPFHALAEVRQLRELGIFPESVTAEFDAMVERCIQPGYEELLETREGETAAELLAQLHEAYLEEFPDFEHADEIRAWLETVERDPDTARAYHGGLMMQLARPLASLDADEVYTLPAWGFDACMEAYIELDTLCAEDPDLPARDSIGTLLERILRSLFYGLVTDARSEFVRVPAFAEVVVARADKLLETRGRFRRLTQETLEHVRNARERALEFTE